MLSPVTGSVPCADGVVDKFVAIVVCCADGDGCTGCGVVFMFRFRIVCVVFFEIGSLSSTLFLDSVFIMSLFWFEVVAESVLVML